MRQLQLASLLLVALVVAMGSSRASAAPVLGGQVIVAADGHVFAEFLGHTAGYSNDLYLDSPANALGIIFNNQTTPVGTVVDLGSFLAGTELIFRIHVNDTGDDFYTGPATRNPDALVHNVVDPTFPGLDPDQIYVGFEDLFGGGDLDYDDLNFAFSNVRAQDPGTVPIPAAGWLGAVALVGLAGTRRARRMI